MCFSYKFREIQCMEIIFNGKELWTVLCFNFYHFLNQKNLEICLYHLVVICNSFLEMSDYTHILVLIKHQTFWSKFPLWPDLVNVHVSKNILHTNNRLIFYVWQFHERTMSGIGSTVSTNRKFASTQGVRVHEVSLRGGNQKIQECKNNSSDACCPQSAGWKFMSLRILTKKISASNLSAGWKHEFKNTASEAWCQQSAGWRCMSLWMPPQRLDTSSLQAGNVWV